MMTVDPQKLMVLCQQKEELQEEIEAIHDQQKKDKKSELKNEIECLMSNIDSLQSANDELLSENTECREFESVPERIIQIKAFHALIYSCIVVDDVDVLPDRMPAKRQSSQRETLGVP